MNRRDFARTTGGSTEWQEHNPMSRQVVQIGASLCIPKRVAVCPYCDGELIAQPTAWEEAKDGTWYASESGLDCTTEPELDDDNEESVEAWEHWLAIHTNMPYVYWLPVDKKVLAWMKKEYQWVEKSKELTP